MESTAPLCGKWWYENFHRIEKLVVCMIILERENLKGFGCDPQWDDTPQYLTYITEKIKTFITFEKPEHKRKYEVLVKETLKGEMTDKYWKKTKQ
jgi:hypothetical protein